MTVPERVRQFIVQNFYVPAEDLQEDTLLIDSGFVDSTGVLELIAFLEGEFGIQIADTDTTPENMGSIARIAAFIASRQVNRIAG